jgi:hypothetical protein
MAQRKYSSTSERRLDEQWVNGKAPGDSGDFKSGGIFDPRDWCPPPPSVPEVEAVLAAREATYGSFQETALLAQLFKRLARQGPGWALMSASGQEAVDAIFVKLARALSGDPTHRDHFLDIAGYAQLVLRELDEERSP